LTPDDSGFTFAVSQSILRYGFGRPAQSGAQRRESGFFVLALWRAVRGTPSGVLGSLIPVDQPAYSSPPFLLGRSGGELQSKIRSSIMQSAQVIPFHFEANQVRTLLIDDQPWFVATDICGALEIRNNRDALSRLDDDEKGVANTDTLGGTQGVGIINESGLYSLILSSRKAEAKRFKKWVTAEVLPAIRKRGRYEDTAGKMSTLIGQTIGTDGFHMLGAVVKGKVSSLPAPIQRRATAKIWSQTHAAFGVRSAADIPADQLDSARNFIAAYALEGEWLGKSAPSTGTALTDSQLYDVYFVAHHFEQLYSIFKHYSLYTHLKGLGSRAGIEMIDHFKDGYAGVARLKSLSGEFDAAQRRLGLNRHRA
jgi:prophage antirepressor-like protein